MKIYNKLVRDKIPEIIEADGKKCETRIADKKEHYELLKAKLQEEVKEFLVEENLEELADVMEVLFGLAESLGYSEEDLIRKREEKREERGVLEKVLYWRRFLINKCKSHCSYVKNNLIFI